MKQVMPSALMVSYKSSGFSACCARCARRYLSFLKGIVDSDTLPLSVSRESLQAHASLKVIKKKLVRKVLDVLKRLSDAERDAAVEEDGARRSLPLCVACSLHHFPASLADILVGFLPPVNRNVTCAVLTLHALCSVLTFRS